MPSPPASPLRHNRVESSLRSTIAERTILFGMLAGFAGLTGSGFYLGMQALGAF